MPKYGIHYIALDKMAQKLSASNNLAEKSIGSIINNNRQAANLGAIGPDLLFWAPDFQMVQSIRNFIDPFDKIMKTFREVEDLVKGIENGISNALNQPKNIVLTHLRSSNIPGVSQIAASVQDLDSFMNAAKQNIDNNISKIQNESLTALFLKGLGMDADRESFTVARSIFQGQFGSGSQIGREEQDWYWFDMLHYRKTGDFTKNLIANAEASGKDELKAYAYAYVTHYVTDTVGHPYVNTISGSPFRIAVQRHAVIENYLDQYEWSTRYKKNIRNDLFSAYNLSNNLSPDLANLISSTINQTYGGANSARPMKYSQNNGFLSSADIDIAFKLQKIVLEFLGGIGTNLKPVEPKPGFDEILSDFMDDIDFPSPPRLNPTPGTGTPNLDNLSAEIEKWLQAISNWINWGLEVAKELVDTIVDAIVALVSLIDNSVVFLIEFLTYAFQSLLYNIYRAIHQILVLSGLAYPEPDDVDLNIPFAKNHITTHLAPSSQSENFPILKFPGQPHLDRKSYKFYSPVNISRPNRRESQAIRDQYRRESQAIQFLGFQDTENPKTKSSFYPRSISTTPSIFIDNSVLSPFDQQAFLQYGNANTPQDTIKLYNSLGRGFGNAVDVSIHILINKNNAAHNVFINWNLDGDRGYAYKTWDGVPFGCIPYENKGLMDGNIVKNLHGFTMDAESDEYPIQDSQVWTTVNLNRTNYNSEIYVNNKLDSEGFLLPLNLSEQNIPSRFTDPNLYFNTTQVTGIEWASLVPSRFSLVPSNKNSDNFFFVNGMATTPNAGLRATIGFEKTLNLALKLSGTHKLNIKYFHNYSDLAWGDLLFVSDILQVIVSDYLNSLLLFHHYNNKAALRNLKITNPTQVAVMALLHKGMVEKKKIMLSAHSQGSIITGCAILAFSVISPLHLSYLKTHVKLFHLEPEILFEIRKKIQEILNVNNYTRNDKYLVYIMNKSDGPLGADILTSLFGNHLPLSPNATGQLIQEISTIQRELNSLISALKDLGKNMDLSNILRIREVIFNNSRSPWIERIFDKFMDLNFDYGMNFDAHAPSNQYRFIKNDIENNLFRSDPRDDVHPDSQGLTGNGQLSRTHNGTQNVPFHLSAIQPRSFLLT